MNTPTLASSPIRQGPDEDPSVRPYSRTLAAIRSVAAVRIAAVGFVVAGFVVAGFVVAGFVVAGFVVAGLALAGCTGSGGGTPSDQNPVGVPVPVVVTTLSNPPAGTNITFREWTVPVASNEPANPPAGCWPDDIDYDELGNIWFAQHHSNQVGRLRQSNGAWFYDGFAIPTAVSEMDSIAVDRIRHTVWVTENAGNKIARLDTTTFPPAVSEINAVTAADPDPVPGDVRVDDSGVPWLTEGYEGGNAVGQIARIDPVTSQITTFRPRPNSQGFDGINFDGGGGVWFVELSDNKVGRFANGQFTEFDLPRANVTPTNIVVDGTGQVWVTEQSGNAIAILNPATGLWRELPVPTAGSLPSGIALDQSGNIWFTEFQSGKVGLVAAGSSTVMEFPIPTANSGPEDVIATPDGHVYFTEQYGNKVGEILVSTAVRSASRKR